MVSCCCVRQGFQERQHGTVYGMKEIAWLQSINFLRTVHVVPRCRSPNPCLPQQQDTICCKNLSLTLLKMGKKIAQNNVELILRMFSVNLCFMFSDSSLWTYRQSGLISIHSRINARQTWTLNKVLSFVTAVELIFRLDMPWLGSGSAALGWNVLVIWANAMTQTPSRALSCKPLCTSTSAFDGI